jgi:isopenicillin N synthase-like dioxygenase
MLLPPPGSQPQHPVVIDGECQRVAREFFDLPLEEKQKLALEHNTTQHPQMAMVVNFARQRTELMIGMTFSSKSNTPSLQRPWKICPPHLLPTGTYKFMRCTWCLPGKKSFASRLVQLQNMVI